ncbi:TetR/AcrR family transcriptional regulator [Curtobacterium sp. NPDC089991]|uniref:TetR/AcrR family transcriptional regulator n=1 Tax=Curtobacterium sp. NPDC089991 TaxID=3363969 RepID=UPI0037F91A87
MTEGTSTAPPVGHRVDPRITRTRAALIRALATLVSEAPKGETISMSAVAQRAGLSRQALHNHYSNVGDLATDLWISRLLEDQLPLDEAAANLPQALTDAVRERGIEPLLAAGRADRGFFDKLRAVPRGERVAEVLAAAMTTWLTESDHDPDHHRPEIALTGDARTFTIGGMIALVSTWQMADAPPSTAEQVATLRTFAAAAAAAGAG